jgi:hypothetical protein
MKQTLDGLIAQLQQMRAQVGGDAAVVLFNTQTEQEDARFEPKYGDSEIVLEF